MEILIIEDDKTKAARLQHFLKSKVPNSIPHLERSYQAGLARIELNRFGVILMDMSLPNYNARPGIRMGRPRAFGGYDIMRKMQKKDITSKVIIVSALEEFGLGDAKMTFEEITSKCAQEFPDLYAGAVYFNQANSKWERRLSNLIQRTREEPHDKDIVG